MNNNPTFNEVVDSMAERQKEALYFLVDYALKKHEAEECYKIVDTTMNENQKLVTYYLISLALLQGGDATEEY